MLYPDWHYNAAYLKYSRFIIFKTLGCASCFKYYLMSFFSLHRSVVACSCRSISVFLSLLLTVLLQFLLSLFLTVLLLLLSSSSFWELLLFMLLIRWFKWGVIVPKFLVNVPVFLFILIESQKISTSCTVPVSGSTKCLSSSPVLFVTASSIHLFQRRTGGILFRIQNQTKAFFVTVPWFIPDNEETEL